MDLLTLMAAAAHEPKAVTFLSAEVHSRYECAACAYKSVVAIQKQYGGASPANAVLADAVLKDTRFPLLRRIPCYTCGVVTEPHSSLQGR